jgi:multiple sugar transport system permease protein
MSRLVKPLFLVPFFALFAAAVIAPLGYTLWLSLFTEKRSGLGFGGLDEVFSGVGNYLTVLNDERFTAGLLVVAVFIVVYIPLMLGLAMLFALLLDSALARARQFFQLALFLPHAVPGSIAALVWTYLYVPGLSPVVALLRDVGIPLDFLSPGMVLPSIINIAVWEWTGYNMVIFYAALKTIPKEVIEAATVDGAGGAWIALRIKLPMIRPALFVALLFTLVGALQLFTEPLLLQSKASAVSSHYTPNMYIFEAAFVANDYGRATAASLLLAVLAGGLSWLVSRRRGALR